VEQIRDALVQALDGSAGLVKSRRFLGHLMSGQVPMSPLIGMWDSSPCAKRINFRITQPRDCLGVRAKPPKIASHQTASVVLKLPPSG